GLRPFVDLTFVDLIGCCYDQIANQAAKMHYMMGGHVDVPMVIRMAYGSRSAPGQTYGGGAAAQHSQTLYSILAHIPGLKVDVLTLAPLDEATIVDSVKKTRRLVVVDEDTPTASMARDIAARVADKGFDYLDAPIKTVTAPEAPVPFASVLENLYSPDAPRVV